MDLENNDEDGEEKSSESTPMEIHHLSIPLLLAQPLLVETTLVPIVNESVYPKTKDLCEWDSAIIPIN